MIKQIKKYFISKQLLLERIIALEKEVECIQNNIHHRMISKVCIDGKEVIKTGNQINLSTGNKLR